MNEVLSENPFLAPRVEDGLEELLADGEEFRVSEAKIFCRGDIELPQLCIHFGESTDLIQRSKTVSVIAPNGIAAAIAAIASIFVCIALCSFDRLIVIMPIVLVLSVVVTLAAGHFLLRYPLSGNRAIRVVWYVSRRHVADRRKYRIPIGLVSAAGAALLPLLFQSSLTDSPILIAFLVGAGVFIGFIAGAERTISLAGIGRFGRKKGLFILQGHSRQFAVAAQRVLADF